MQLPLQVKHTQCEATSERAAEVQGRGSSKSVYVVPHFQAVNKHAASTSVGEGNGKEMASALSATLLKERG